MFSKVSLSLVLATSLACFCQVTTMGGYATTSSAPMTPSAPIISTPDIALPGSGPAVGAPLSNSNDPRTSTGPSIHDPNYVSPVSESAQSASFSPSNPAGANENFEVGIQRFVSGAPAATTPTRSLAEIARSIKAQHPKAARSFNNESIAKLNADGVRTGNLGPTEVAQAPAEENPLVAENRMPALPQSDEPAIRVNPRENSATTAQQRQRVEAPTETASAAPAPVQPQASAAPEQAQNTAKLPQGSSYLPIILFLGLIAVAGGTIFFMRR